MLFRGAGELGRVVEELDKLSAMPMQIAWRCARQEESVASVLSDVASSFPDVVRTCNEVINYNEPGEAVHRHGDLLAPQARSC
jgi:hypothetical protein